MQLLLAANAGAVRAKAERHSVFQSATINNLEPYASQNLTRLRMPSPLAYPFYSAEQTHECNVYVPNGDTLSRYIPAIPLEALQAGMDIPALTMRLIGLRRLDVRMTGTCTAIKSL